LLGIGPVAARRGRASIADGVRWGCLTSTAAGNLLVVRIVTELAFSKDGQ
jgi:hypothetical protein